MTVIDRPWLFRDDDGRPRFKTSWHEEMRARGPRWPGPLPPKEFEAHDPATRKLIEQYNTLYRLEYGEVIAPLLDRWKWMDKMESAAEKQRFLEPLLLKVKRDPDHNEATLVFLLLVCEGIRRGVAKELLAARAGLEPRGPAPSWHRREEARRLEEIERERVYEVTREATLEAIYRYPSPPPRHFFGWLRETVAHRSLSFLQKELSELETAVYRVDEAEAMQAVLAGLDGADPPQLADTSGMAAWRLRIRPRPLYEAVHNFWQLAQVRSICRTALDRLPSGQRAVIEAHFYDGMEPQEIADERGVARSTIYNLKAQGLRSLHDDDCFFMALCGMRLVRDSVRRDALMRRYPDGQLPDGRRLVVIDPAA
jgi:DNA-directed RNA polymerase specialized sigma24 family protein